MLTSVRAGVSSLSSQFTSKAAAARCLRARQLGCSAPVVPRHVKNRAALTTAQSFSAAPNQFAEPPVRRVFADYAIYKGKAAIQFKVIKPEWVASPDGSLRVNREGVLLLEFANALGGSGVAREGDRRYDWENKVNFALSASEIGAMVTNETADFFHDPNKGTSNEGTTRKSFKIAPMNQGYFFSISVREGGRDQNMSVPVSPAEYTVIKRLGEYLIPHLLGFDEIFQGPPDVANTENRSGNNTAAYAGSN